MKNVKLIFIVPVLLIFAGCNINNNVELTTDDFGITEVESEVYESTTTPSPDYIETEETTNNVVVGNTDSTDMCFYGKNTGTTATITGLEPLQLIDFSGFSLIGYDEFSKEMLSHGYGVAQNQIPHDISIYNQKFFDENNFDAICLDDIPDQKKLYLTFDCGYENGYTGIILDILKEKNVPAAFFCTLPQVKGNPELIARMINEGHIVGNHSVTHPDFSSLNPDEIVKEIQGFDDYIRENFGYSSLYFRYPQGKYSQMSTFVINKLGYSCVFWSLAYADWDVENPKGASYAYETVMSRMHPGAVILLHAVSPDNAGALADIIDSARQMGYVFVSLDEFRK